MDSAKAAIDSAGTAFSGQTDTTSESLEIRNQGINCTHVFDDAYNNEFSKMLVLMGNSDPNRLRNIVLLIKPGVSEIKSAFDSCNYLYNKLVVKYQVQTVDPKNAKTQ